MAITKEQLNIKVVVEFEGGKKVVKAITGDFKKLTDAVEKTGKAIEGTTKAAESAAKRQKSQIETILKQNEKLKTQIENVGKSEVERIQNDLKLTKKLIEKRMKEGDVNEELNDALQDQLKLQKKLADTKISDVIDKTNKGLQKQTKNLKGATSGFKGMALKIIATNQAMEILEKGISLITNIIRFTIVNFAQFEKGLVSVIKTVGLTEKAAEKFKLEVVALSQNIPATTSRLFEIGKAAGQLGVRSKDLTKFIETIVRLGVSADIAGEEAAIAASRILGLTQTPTDQIDKFSSALVNLGNNLRANEAEILRTATVIAQGIGVFGASASQVLALAGAARDLGVRFELAGSAIARSFIEIANSINKGGIAVETLGKLTKIGADELKKAFSEDAVGVFREFLRGLSSATAAETAKILESINLVGVEINRVIPTLAKNVDRLDLAFELARMNNAAALMEESNRAFNTMDANITKLMTAFGLLGTVIGTLAEPFINAFITLLTELLNGFNNAALGATGLIRAMSDISNFIFGFDETAKDVAKLGENIEKVIKPTQQLATEATLTAKEFQKMKESFEARKVIDDVLNGLAQVDAVVVGLINRNMALDLVFQNIGATNEQRLKNELARNKEIIDSQIKQIEKVKERTREQKLSLELLEQIKDKTEKIAQANISEEQAKAAQIRADALKRELDAINEIVKANETLRLQLKNIGADKQEEIRNTLEFNIRALNDQIVEAAGNDGLIEQLKVKLSLTKQISVAQTAELLQKQSSKQSAQAKRELNNIRSIIKQNDVLKLTIKNLSATEEERITNTRIATEKLIHFDIQQVQQIKNRTALQERELRLLKEKRDLTRDLASLEIAAVQAKDASKRDALIQKELSDIDAIIKRNDALIRQRRNLTASAIQRFRTNEAAAVQTMQTRIAELQQLGVLNARQQDKLALLKNEIKLFGQLTQKQIDLVKARNKEQAARALQAELEAIERIITQNEALQLQLDNIGATREQQIKNNIAAQEKLLSKQIKEAQGNDKLIDQLQKTLKLKQQIGEKTILKIEFDTAFNDLIRELSVEVVFGEKLFGIIEGAFKSGSAFLEKSFEGFDLTGAIAPSGAIPESVPGVPGVPGKSPLAGLSKIVKLIDAVQALINFLPSLIKKMDNVVISLTNLPLDLAAGLTKLNDSVDLFISNFVDNLVASLPTIVEKIVQIMIKGSLALVNTLPIQFIKAIPAIIKGMVDGLISGIELGLKEAANNLASALGLTDFFKIDQKNLDEIVRGVTGVGAQLFQVAELAAEAEASKRVEELKREIDTLLERIKKFFGEAGQLIWDGFVKHVKNAFFLAMGGHIWNGLVAAFNLLERFWEKHGEAILQGFRDALKANPLFFGLGFLIWDGLVAASNLIKRFWEKHGEAIIEGLKESLKNNPLFFGFGFLIWDGLVAASKLLERFWEKHGEAIMDGLKEALKANNLLFFGMGGLIWDGLVAASNVVEKFWEKHGDDIFEGFKTAIDLHFFGGYGEEIFGGLKTALGLSGTLFGNMGTAIFKGLKLAVKLAPDFFDNMGFDIWNAFETSVIGGINSVLELLDLEGVAVPQWVTDLGVSLTTFLATPTWIKSLVNAVNKLDSITSFGLGLTGGSAKGGLIGMAGGGVVNPSDTVARLLTPGEFVINRPAVQQIGTGVLKDINAGRSPMGGGNVSNVTINLKIDSRTEITDDFVRNKLMPDIKSEFKRASLDGAFIISARGIR